jgi:signal transduction histidine kinase
VEGLAGELLGRLVSSGRIATAMLYVWDEERNIFRLIAQKGKEPSSLTRMAGEPLREAVPALGVFVRPWLELERQHHPKQERAAGLLVALDGLKADAVLPLRVGQTILGWLVLSDGDGGGFSVEEIHRLERLAARATILLENLHDFERLKEMHRLAALGTMAAGLAHEIRNPLAGIKGAAQYLQAEEGPPDREMVQVIVDEADRLNVVVSQFLDYARPLSLQLEPLRLEGLIAQVANLFRAQGLMDVVWKEDLTADLPLVPADAPRLKQVLLNLCQNAVQAMRGGGTLTLRTRLGRLRDPQRGEQPCVELSVEDSGCGISKEDLEQLFIPFFTTRPDGTGLGLPICQRIVQAHHGELDVHTEIGKGSTFILRLPL